MRLQISMNRVGTPSRPNDQRLFRLLAIGQALLIAVTWPLWTPQTAFPQVPLVQAAGKCPQE
ncbi:hypothetical protein ABTB59_19260, partial [Acinetobacter baumannii]